TSAAMVGACPRRCVCRVGRFAVAGDRTSARRPAIVLPAPDYEVRSALSNIARFARGAQVGHCDRHAWHTTCVRARRAPCDDRFVTEPEDDVLAEARAALRAGDGVTARRLLEPVAGAAPSGEVLEALARAAYLRLEYPSAIEHWEHAYA